MHESGWSGAPPLCIAFDSELKVVERTAQIFIRAKSGGGYRGEP